MLDPDTECKICCRKEGGFHAFHHFPLFFLLVSNKTLYFINLQLTMITIDRLPKEILLRVLEHVDKRSLWNCIQVSKKWQSPATEAYYEVTLQAYQIHKIKSLFEENQPNQDDYFSQLHWTRKLNIEFDGLDALGAAFRKWMNVRDGEKSQHVDDSMLDSRCEFESREFTVLMSYLPNLQEIDLNNSRRNNIYMAYLRDIDSTTYLKRIERIYSKNPGSGQDPLAHFATYYDFKRTLTHAVYNHSANTTVTLENQVGDALSFLPNFESLTHLTFNNGLDQIDDFTVYDMSAICPKLRSLRFSNDYINAPDAPDALDRSLNDILGGLNKEEALLNSIQENLQALEIYLSNLSSTYVK